MGSDKHSESRSSSSRRSKDDRHQHKSSSSNYSSSSKKSAKSQYKSGRHGDGKRESRIVDDDADEDEVWVEKGDGEADQPDSIANIPSRQALDLKSRAYEKVGDPALPQRVTSESLANEKRDDWMLETIASSSTTQRPAPMRQSDNLTLGGTFSVGEVPTGIARPSKHNTVEQMTDGYGEGEVGTKGTFGGDFFSSMGSERKRKEAPKPKADAERPKMSSREINIGLYAADGTRLDDTVVDHVKRPSATTNTTDSTRPPLPGSAGSSWRMMKLKRAYEAAEDEGRDSEQVGIERFGTKALWEAAKEEKDYLDGRGGRSQGGRHRGVEVLSGRSDRHRSPPISQRAQTPEGTFDEFGRERRSTEELSAHASAEKSIQGRYIFNESVSNSGSRPPSRAGSFRRPGSSADDLADRLSRSATPTTQQRAAAERATPKASTPIPSVFTPPVAMSAAASAQAALVRRPSQLQESSIVGNDTVVNAVQQSEGDLSRPAMDQTALNRLQAKILRGRLMGTNNNELKSMEEQYEAEVARSRQGDGGNGYFDDDRPGHSKTTEVRVLPTLDGQGRLYDVGTGKEGAAENDATIKPGNRKRKKEKYFETRDVKTGELLRYNADDDDLTLQELLRQEKFGGGSADQKNMDYEVANRIATDAKFEDDLDYMDDTAERLARKKQKTEQQKKMFAINDFAKTKKALDSCQFCYQDTDKTSVPPQAAMVCLGTRTFLSLPLSEPLTDGHALIVPLQHHMSMLEADDDTWDEVRNYMKTLMQMNAARDRGVIFYETVLSFKNQRHTYIECVPIPWETFEELPGYFHEAISTSEAEWSQHKKLIDFSSRPGGFRRSMVSNLPYFMVQWDYKGEKGYGHVIEGGETATGVGDGYDIDEGAKGGGEFPRYFAAEIIGNVLDLEPRKWRKPRRMDKRLNDERVKEFRKDYDAYDWTKLLARTEDRR